MICNFESLPGFSVTGWTSPPCCSLSSKDEQSYEQGLSLCVIQVFLYVTSVCMFFQEKRVALIFPASALLKVSVTCLT